MSGSNKVIEEFYSGEDLTERQKKILAAAIEIFAEKGFAATSTSEIAKKAGVAEGTIFKHYKTKKGLLLSIASPIMAKMIAPFVIKDLNKVLKQDYENFEDFLKAMIENRTAFVKNNMPLFRILFQELPFHPELKEYFKKHIAVKVFERLREIVEYYQVKGQIIKMPPSTVIRMSGSTIMGYFIARYYLVPEAEWDDEAEIERTIQFLIKGLSPEEESL